MKPFLLSLFFPFVSLAQDHLYLVTGTYTSGGSEGIYVYHFNGKTGKADLVSSVKSSNPSFLAFSPNEKFLYAVNEDDSGTVSAFAFDKQKGSLTPLNRQSSAGRHPCYVTVDRTGKWVIAGNYSSGNLAILPAAPDGRLDSAVHVIQHSGYGVNEDRQKGPHVHATVLSRDNQFLLVPDLGIDKLMVYTFDDRRGAIAEADPPYGISEPGAGPRHLDFHPNGKTVYLMEELTGTIAVFAYAKGRLDLLQNISALPGDYNGPTGSADIHVSPDGRFLYASNRGESNTIAIFSIGNNGWLSLVGHQPTLGSGPRNFSLHPSGKFLLVANQNSNEIVVFRRNRKTGTLTDTGNRIKVSKPVCLKWANM